MYVLAWLAGGAQQEATSSSENSSFTSTNTKYLLILNEKLLNSSEHRNTYIHTYRHMYVLNNEKVVKKS